MNHLSLFFSLRKKVSTIFSTNNSNKTALQVDLVSRDMVVLTKLISNSFH